MTSPLPQVESSSRQTRSRQRDVDQVQSAPKRHRGPPRAEGESQDPSSKSGHEGSPTEGGHSTGCTLPGRVAPALALAIRRIAEIVGKEFSNQRFRLVKHRSETKDNTRKRRLRIRDRRHRTDHSRKSRVKPVNSNQVISSIEYKEAVQQCDTASVTTKNGFAGTTCRPHQYHSTTWTSYCRSSARCSSRYWNSRRKRTAAVQDKPAWQAQQRTPMT